MNDDLKQFEIDDDELESVAGGLEAEEVPPCQGNSIVKINRNGPISCSNCRIASNCSYK